MKITFCPDNVPVEIDNIRSVGLEKNFLNPKSGVTLNVESFSLLNEAYTRMKTWLYNEQGRFENAPALVTTNPTNGVNTVYPAYIDQKDMEIGFNRITCNIQFRKSYGQFFDQMSGLTFELLYEKGGLPDSVIVDVPYIIIPDNLRYQKVVAIITELSLAFQIGITVKEIIDVPLMLLNPLNLAVSIAQLAILIVFLLLMIIAFVQASSALKELYFPKVRYLKGVSDYNLIKYACIYLGYTFQSTMMVNELWGMHTIGKPIAIEGEGITEFFDNEITSYFNKGYPTAGDTIPTADLLVDHYLDTYDSMITIVDGDVVLERESYFAGNASIVLDPTLSDQENHDNKYKFNDDAAWGRKYDHWADDQQDIHSIEANKPMKAEYITEPVQVINADLFHLTGLKENAAPFAPAQRKNGYTRLEASILELFTTFDAIINLFSVNSGTNGSSNLAQGISNRDGIMIIERQYFSVTKKMWGTPVTQIINGASTQVLKQPSNFQSIMAMSNIHDLFNLGQNVINNNYRIEAMSVPFTDPNFQSLLANNFVIWKPTGDSVKVLNAVWRNMQYKVDLIVRIPDESAFNTKTTRIV